MVDKEQDATGTGGEPADGTGLADRRVLVVGASAGIGRAFASRALREGAYVAVTSRRADRIDALVAGSARTTGAVGDVRNAQDCARVVAEAARVLGQIDLIVFSAGVAPLQRMDMTTEEDWASVLETHVLGLHHVIQAALAHLAPSAVVAAISSETVGRPRTGLGAYGASKAALEESIRAWNMEYPRLRFLTVAVGATFPTEFGNSFDPGRLTAAMDDWTRRGLMTEDMMDPDDVAGTLAGILGAALNYPGVGIEHLVLRPNLPVVGIEPPPT